jgi:membrane peptidoglycan carboxypeptidase
MDASVRAMQEPTPIDPLNTAPLPEALQGNTAPLHGTVRLPPPLTDVPELPVAVPRRRGWLLGCLLGVALLVLLESQTSVLQALFFTHWSRTLSYHVETGAAGTIAFPATGPFDERRGYTRLPALLPRLAGDGLAIAAQARQTPELTDLIRRGIAPPFREPAAAGLTIRDARGELLYAAPDVQAHVWTRLEDIPPLVVQTLLFIENRSIGAGFSPLDNPAVDLTRTGKAVALYLGRGIGLSWPLEGGSTLATQLAKFWHSPGGHTATAAEKLRQIVAASLAAYHEGWDTRERRGQIILDYLNTMPLGAAPAVGEVNGLAQGLSAWFGEDSEAVFAALRSAAGGPARARAYREVLALLYAVHAPSHYLAHEHAALDARIDAYLPLLTAAGVLEGGFATQIAQQRLSFAKSGMPAPAAFVGHKADNAVRTELAGLLGAGSLYELDRLAVTADTTIDGALQARIGQVLGELADPDFVAQAGLAAPHLLDRGDPAGITYSVLLMESLPGANVVRVHTDTRNGPLDVNDGTKLELGSTAKLRTLVHYLEIVAQLHDTLNALPPQALARTAVGAWDPITRWAALTLFATPDLTLPELLERALDRRYAGSPEETFFTGGGLHHFHNFEPEDDLVELSVRQAMVRSSNLVFIRLMRDLVRFHAARLPYDARAALEERGSAARRMLLDEIVSDEQRRTGREAGWLFSPHNRAAADVRLRIRVERDAFARMTPAWRRLGFPFEHLVPSLATAIGSSADRPMALAELMGILVNDGRRLPTADVARLTLAAGTPYETVLTRAPAAGEQVVRPEIARAVRAVLGQVVEDGTARRLKGVFHDAQGLPVAIGGKTGSGDNRHETFARGGVLLTAQPVSRTAVFVFYLGRRCYGVITASVDGPAAGGYDFTSSLPLAVLKLLAPALCAALHPAPPHDAGGTPREGPHA